jgi:hypothetical protein
LKLAKRTVYFPYDYQSTSGRHYKSDVRAALAHGLAVELEREQQERQHEMEMTTLQQEIATLTATLEAARGPMNAARISDAGISDPTLDEAAENVARVTDTELPVRQESSGPISEAAAIERLRRIAQSEVEDDEFAKEDMAGLEDDGILNNDSHLPDGGNTR